MAFPGAVVAQTLVPLSELIGGQAEPSYPLVRCAAFYQAGAEWTGQERMGAEAWARTDQSIRMLLTFAVLIRVSRGEGASEQITDIVMRDTRNIADLYLRRFELNYAAQGQAWGADALWASDAQLCRSVADAAAASVPN